MQATAAPTGKSDRPGLVRGLGLGSAFCVVAGSVIGSGVFLVASDISRSRAQSTIDGALAAMAEGILLFDPDDRLVRWNRHYELLFPHLAPLLRVGMPLSELHAASAKHLLPDGSAVRQGVAVTEVVREGPAWNAGIRPNDVIVAVDGEPVADASQLALAISQREPGSRVEFEVNRRRESFQTYATLIQQPPLE